MANPFGGFGGQQNVFASGAQQQQTSPFAGSTAPVFGQSPFGQASTTSASSFVSNVFGQTVSQSSPQTNPFSGQPASTASTVASSSLFGKPSVFAQNVSSSQSGFFSSQTDNSNTKASSSVFGQASVFGQTSSVKNVFGSPGFGTSSTGSSVSSTPSPSLFSGIKQHGSTVKGTSVGSTSTGPFGNNPVSSSGLFTGPASTASAFTASSGFMSVKKEPDTDSKPMLFGTQGGGPKAETRTLFGKIYKEENTTGKPATPSVFGGTKIKQEENAGKAEEFVKQTTGGLFGKGKQSTQALFGKSTAKDTDKDYKGKFN